MAADVLAEVDEASLRAVAPEIWDMMLGLPLASDDAIDGSFPELTRTITGMVTVVGDFTGAVTLECTTQAAQRFAAAMFGADDPADVPIEEIRDAHAELTNMTGGNIKNLLGELNRLGIPTVTEGLGYTIALPRTRPVALWGFRCGEDAVVVRLYQRS